MPNFWLYLATSNPVQNSNTQEIMRSFSLIALFIVAVVLLFWGKKILHIFLFLFGLIGGLIVGVMTSPYLNLTDSTKIIYCLVLAVVGAVIFSIALAFSFFLAGNVLGYLAFNSLKSVLPLSWQALWCLIVFCLICGIMSVALKEQAIAIFASFTGGLFILDICFSLIFNQAPLTFINKGFQILDGATSLLAIILLLILTVLGSLYQLGKIKVRN